MDDVIMYEVTLSEPMLLQMTKSAGSHNVGLEAGRPFVFGDDMFERNARGNPEFTAKLFRSSRIDYEIISEPWNTPGTVLLWQGSGGYGDQIMTWPVAKALHERGFTVHVMVEPGNDVCWQCFPWIDGVHLMPMQRGLFDLFTHYLTVDYAANRKEGRLQADDTRLLLQRCGIYDKPARVSPNYTEVEEHAAESFVKEKGEFAIYQLAASNMARSLSYKHSIDILRALAREWPELRWVCPHDPWLPEQYALELEKDRPKNVDPIFFQNLRNLWSITRRAKVVIAPDSMMMHVAGCQDVPCVALFGPGDPNTKCHVYDSVIPIWAQQRCAFAPCNTITGDLPFYCPGREKTGWCDVTSGIQPETVFAAVRKATHGKLVGH